jgi:hypothetical protein
MGILAFHHSCIASLSHRASQEAQKGKDGSWWVETQTGGLQGAIPESDRDSTGAARPPNTQCRGDFGGKHRRSRCLALHVLRCTSFVLLPTNYQPNYCPMKTDQVAVHALLVIVRSSPYAHHKTTAIVGVGELISSALPFFEHSGIGTFSIRRAIFECHSSLLFVITSTRLLVVLPPANLDRR